MTICTTCGAESAERVSRGPLTVQLEPPRASWRGMPLRMSPSQLRLLHLLCARGRASHLAVQLVCTGEDALPNTAKVVMTRVRAIVPREIEIRSIHGWGYELIIKEMVDG